MMGFMRAIRSGSSEGKGHKYYRRKDYEKALKYFLAALKYEDNEGGKPVLMEHITRSLIGLEKYTEALSYAEESFHLYKNQENINQLFKDGARRMQELIEQMQYLKKKDE